MGMTQPIMMWFMVSSCWSHNGQTLWSDSPLLANLSDVQHQSLMASHAKKRHWLGALDFHVNTAVSATSSQFANLSAPIFSNLDFSKGQETNRLKSSYIATSTTYFFSFYYTFPEICGYLILPSSHMILLQPISSKHMTIIHLNNEKYSYIANNGICSYTSLWMFIYFK